METDFVKTLRGEANKTLTENGANAFKSTESKLLDLYATIGAIRGQDVRLRAMIDGAYKEDKNLLAKTLFYARDIRGGLGERDTFREAIKYCAVKYPDVVRPNISAIPEYGRWDDMFALMGTPLESTMFNHMRMVLDADYMAVADGKRPKTLLVKWLPTADASSANTREFAKKVAKGLGFTGTRAYKEYYRPIRKALKVVEAQMSANEWGEVNYPAVPSRAMLVHRQAFYKHDEDRMKSYINAVTTGKAKINASTLYPYDIVEKILYKHENGAELEAMWKAMPNYVEGENNYLVMADTSGSMQGRPMATALGLAVYFAERNKGAYKDLFMTFASKPRLYTLDADSLAGNLRAMENMHICENTNLEAGLKCILDLAVQTHSKQDEIPKALIVISDMEFDQATSPGWWGHRENTWVGGLSFYESMKQMYANYGYTIPNIVFWNVDSRNETFHVAKDCANVQLVSGQSTAVFKQLCGTLEGKTPYDFMVESLNVERYAPIHADNL